MAVVSLFDSSINTSTPGVMWLTTQDGLGLDFSNDVTVVDNLPFANRPEHTRVVSSYIEGGGTAYVGFLKFFDSGNIQINLATSSSDTGGSAGPEFTDETKTNLGIALRRNDGTTYKWLFSDIGDSTEPYSGSLSGLGLSFNQGIVNNDPIQVIFVDRNDSSIDWDNLSTAEATDPVDPDPTDPVDPVDPTPTESGISLFDSSITNDTLGVAWLATTDPYFQSDHGVRVVGQDRSDRQARERIDSEYVQGGGAAYVVTLLFRDDNVFNPNGIWLELDENYDESGSSSNPQLTNDAEQNLGLAIRTDAGNEYKWRLDLLVSSDNTEPYRWDATSVGQAGPELTDTIRNDILNSSSAQSILVDRTNPRIDWDNLRYVIPPLDAEADIEVDVDFSADADATPPIQELQAAPIYNGTFTATTGELSKTNIPPQQLQSTPSFVGTFTSVIANLNKSTVPSQQLQATRSFSGAFTSTTATLTKSTISPNQLQASPAFTGVFSTTATLTKSTISPNQLQATRSFSGTFTSTIANLTKSNIPSKQLTAAPNYTGTLTTTANLSKNTPADKQLQSNPSFTGSLSTSVAILTKSSGDTSSPANQTITLSGFDINGLWTGAILINASLIENGEEAYLRYIERIGSNARLRLSSTTTGDPDDLGPDFTTTLELYDQAFTFTANNSSVVLKGPHHNDNAFSEGTEPYFWTPDNGAEWNSWVTNNFGDEVTLELRDGTSGTSDLSPTAPAISAQTGIVNTPLSVQLPVGTGGDPPLSYSATNLPTGTSFRASDRTIHGTPTTEGTFHVVYTVTDTDGDTDSTVFTFAIVSDPTTLSLSDLDQTGYDFDALALFIAGEPPVVYGIAPRPTIAGTLVDGEIGIAGVNEPVTWLRFRDADSTNAGSERISLNDNGGLDQSVFWNGDGNDLTLFLQTSTLFTSFPIAGNIEGSGGNYVIFSVPSASQDVVESISEGDRFILGFGRSQQVSPLDAESDISVQVNLSADADASLGLAPPLEVEADVNSQVDFSADADAILGSSPILDAEANTSIEVDFSADANATLGSAPILDVEADASFGVDFSTDANANLSPTPVLNAESDVSTEINLSVNANAELGQISTLLADADANVSIDLQVTALASLALAPPLSAESDIDTEVNLSVAANAELGDRLIANAEADTDFEVDFSVNVDASLVLVAPGLPVNINTDATGQTSISVTWSAPAFGPTPTGYDLQWRQGSSGAWTEVLNATSPRTISSLVAGTFYQIQVRAKNSVGNGNWSASVSETTDVDPNIIAPNEPVSIKIIVVNESTLRIEWSAAAFGGTPSGYDLQWKVGKGTTYTLVENVTSPYVLSGLQDSTLYEIQLRSKNSGGNSKWVTSRKALSQESYLLPLYILNVDNVISDDLPDEFSLYDILDKSIYTIDWTMAPSTIQAQTLIPYTPDTGPAIHERTRNLVEEEIVLFFDGSEFRENIRMIERLIESANQGTHTIYLAYDINTQGTRELWRSPIVSATLSMSEQSQRSMVEQKIVMNLRVVREPWWEEHDNVRDAFSTRTDVSNADPISIDGNSIIGTIPSPIEIKITKTSSGTYNKGMNIQIFQDNNIKDSGVSLNTYSVSKSSSSFGTSGTNILWATESINPLKTLGKTQWYRVLIEHSVSGSNNPLDNVLMRASVGIGIETLFVTATENNRTFIGDYYLSGRVQDGRESHWTDLGAVPIYRETKFFIDVIDINSWSANSSIIHFCPTDGYRRIEITCQVRQDDIIRDSGIDVHTSLTVDPDFPVSEERWIPGGRGIGLPITVTPGKDSKLLFFFENDNKDKITEDWTISGTYRARRLTI